MSDQYVTVKREWLEGLLEKAEVLEELVKHQDNYSLMASAAMLAGYINSAKHILELDDYKRNLEKSNE